MPPSSSPIARRWAGDVLGSFGDAAVLFPLLTALSLRSDFTPWKLLASAGLAYMVSGMAFRVPTPVQPLKSVAISAVALGVGAAEVRWAGAMVGLLCLILSFSGAGRLIARFPKPLIHGIQASLGALFILEGARFASGHLIASALAVGLLWAFRASRFPLMGLAAAGSVLWGIAHASPGAGALPAPPSSALSAWEIAFSLCLPQIALTLSNSVAATADAARRYFGPESRRMTPKNLLRVIGAGNLLSAAFAGLPFCHGSGGLTAHVQSGARTWRMNLIIGGFLLALAGASFRGGCGVSLCPPAAVGVLLAATGLFHARLAAPTWGLGWSGRLRILAMTAATLATRNLLWAMAAGLLIEPVFRARGGSPREALA